VLAECMLVELCMLLSFNAEAESPQRLSRRFTAQHRILECSATCSTPVA